MENEKKSRDILVDRTNHVFLWAFSIVFLAAVWFLSSNGDPTHSFLSFSSALNFMAIPAGKVILTLCVIWILHILLLLIFPKTITSKKQLLIIFAIAIAARFILLSIPPSDDVNRYLWEGKITAAGFSPYVHAPVASNDKHVDRFRNSSDKIWSGINHPKMTAIYPQGFQRIMALLSNISYTLLAAKFLVIIFDLLTAVFLVLILKYLSLDLRWVILYLLNPVVLLSFAGSGHQDSMMLFFVVAAIYFSLKENWLVMYLMLALSFQMKYMSIICFPFFISKRNIKYSIILPIVAFSPIAYSLLTSGDAIFASFKAFGTKFSFNGFFPSIISYFISNKGLAGILNLSLFILAYVIIFVKHFRTHDSNIKPMIASYKAFGLLLFFLPTVHFWYVSWIVPFLALRPKVSWLILTATASFALIPFCFVANFSGDWFYPIWAHVSFWFLPVCFLSREVWRSLKHDYSVASLTCKNATIVIPTLNEEARIEESINAIKLNELIAEVIVVDGGSTDKTIELASKCGANIVKHNNPINDGGGRGGQISAGCSKAIGDVIVIVHSDTLLQPDAVKKIMTMLNANSDIVGGAYGSIFDGGNFGLRALEVANNMRAALFSVSFGDQVQFFRRSIHNKHILMPDMPLMEDVEFSYRLMETGQSVFMWGSNLVAHRQWKTSFMKRVALILSLFFSYIFKRLFTKVDISKYYERYYNNQMEKKKTKTIKVVLTLFLIMIFTVFSAQFIHKLGAEEMKWDTTLEWVRKTQKDMPEISTDKLFEIMNDKQSGDLLIFDVRPIVEFEVSHINGAYRVDNLNDVLQTVKAHGNNDVKVVVYCSVGYRSALLALQLRRAGIKNVFNLFGSIFKWANEGKPVYKQGNLTNKVHPYDSKWGKLLKKELRYEASR